MSREVTIASDKNAVSALVIYGSDYLGYFPSNVWSKTKRKHRTGFFKNKTVADNGELLAEFRLNE